MNAFLILLLSGAAGRVLTWLSKGSLRLPHLLIHPGQTQPGGEERDVSEGGKMFLKHLTEGFCSSTHSVTISALACCTAILRGSWPSSSSSFCVAPLFRNKHTCLKVQQENVSQDERNSFGAWLVYKPRQTPEFSHLQEKKTRERSVSDHVSQQSQIINQLLEPFPIYSVT